METNFDVIGTLGDRPSSGSGWHLEPGERIVRTEVLHGGITAEMRRLTIGRRDGGTVTWCCGISSTRPTWDMPKTGRTALCDVPGDRVDAGAGWTRISAALWSRCWDLCRPGGRAGWASAALVYGWIR